MDIWLENHIEKHLILKTTAILVTDTGEHLWHTDKNGNRVPFNIEIDLFDVDKKELERHGLTMETT